MSDESFQSALAQIGDSGLRHAAALIHALAPADRRWAIEQLPVHRREAVEALLAELVAMGLPRERAIVEAALHWDPARGPQDVAVIAAGSGTESVSIASRILSRTPDASSTASLALMPTSDGATALQAACAAIDLWVAAQGAPALVRCIAGEPAPLIGRLFALRDWSWRPEALRLLQPALREDVVEAMRLRAGDDARLAAADARLLELLAQRLATLHPVHEAPALILAGSRRASQFGMLSRLLSRWRSRRGAE